MLKLIRSSLLLIKNRSLSYNVIAMQKVTIGESIGEPINLVSKNKEFYSKVNQKITETRNDRHFAVVHMYGRQFFIREGDLFKVDKQVPAGLGERVKLEKVLLIGNDQITLLGRPLLNRNQVNVEVTPVEITQSHSINRHIFTRRQQGTTRWRFHRHPLTIFRVNAIEIKHGIDENPTKI